VSSDDEESERAGKLIERLLVDPPFRAEFRRDPAQACVAAGLPELAAELGGSGKAMYTLEMRESRSSLAGVVMAMATEGVALSEMQHLVQHGLPGGLGKALHGVKLPRGVRGLQRAASPAAVERKLEHGVGLRPSSVKKLADAAGAGGVGGTAAESSGAGGGAGGAAGSGVGGAAGAAAGSGAGGAAGAAAGSGAGGAAAAGSGVSGVASGSAGGGSVSEAVSSSSAGSGSAGGGSAGAAPGSAMPWPDQTPAPGGAGAAIAQAPAPGGAGAAIAQTPAPGGAGAAIAQTPAPGGAGAAITQTPAPGGAGAAITQTPAPGGAGAAITQAPAAGGAGSSVATPPTPGASPIDGGAVPQWPDQVPTAGAGAADLAVGSVPAPTGLSELLTSPRLSAPPDIRAWLATGGVDPRLVSTLDSALANHSIGIANVESLSTPVHVQTLDIVSVDGQPVGPDNFAARDLVTEIAALNPSIRPDEIGTPWPIQSQGFFSDTSSTNNLHLAFEMPGTDSPTPSLNAPTNLDQTPGAGSPAQAEVAYPAPGQGQVEYGAAGQSAPGASASSLTPGAGASSLTPGAGASAGGQPVVASTAVGGAPGAGSSAAENLAGTPASPLTSDPSFASPKAHEAFEAAKKELGVPYQWGGTSPKTGFDCSGLMQWSYHQVGINLPRVAADQFHVGTPVSLNDLHEGDLVFFKDSTGYIHHVGMYVGNHMFLEAPSTGEVVKYADLRDPYWAQQFAGGRRIVPLDASGAAPGQSTGTDVTGTAGASSAAPPSGADAATGVPAGSGAAAATDAPAGAASASAAAGASPDSVPGADAAGVPPASVPGGIESVPGTPPPGTPPPGTAAFKALALQERSFKLHTVQFLQAVQPAQGSPLAAQAAAAAPIEPASGGQVPVEPVSGQAQMADVSVPGTADQVAGQAAEAVPVGGAISVSSSLLTSGQETFAAHLAQLTGLSPRVVAAWELAEESGSPAQGRQAASNFNWLNIGYFDSGTGPIAFNKAFSDPVSAAEQTAKFLKGEWGGASSSIRAILSSVGQSPDQQMAAIANSDWASTHYDGGASLRGTFQELADLKVQSTGATPGVTLA